MPSPQKIYIVELASNEKLIIDHIPEELSDSASAKLPAVAVAGRNLEQYQHAGVSNDISFQISLSGVYENDPEYVLKKVKWLKSLVFNEGRTKPASYVQIIWGSVFKGLNFVVASVSAKTSDFRPAKKYNPLRAKVDITFKLVGDVTKTSIRK
jgi:hypothetical protein